MASPTGEARPTIDEIVVGDEPDAWRAAHFSVDDDGTCRIGAVRIRLVGADGDRGILRWSIRDLAGGSDGGDIDGVPTDASDMPPAEPAEHPCGATVIDHVVLMSPDGERTAAALTAATGLEVRRVRDTESYGAPMRQRFFRLGEVILELVSTEPPSAGEPRFFGLAVTVADIDRLPALYGDHLGSVKDAVQPGRRIAGLRHRGLDISVPMILMTPEPGR